MMEQKDRRRSTGKVDRLPPELKDTVEQMLLTGCTYKEIVAFLKENGEEMSQMAICTYAKKYLATVEMINVAQSNFSMLMDEMNRYPDLDTSEALIRLARLGDFEGVITEIDAYNKVQSNTANYFQYNDDAILKVLKLGDVSSQDIADMKEKGAIILEDGGDVDWLLKTIDDTALENYKNRLREDIHTGANVPHMCDESFGGNLSGVAISYKLWGLEQISSIKERKFKKGLQRRIELITNILNIMGHNYDYRDIIPKFRRNRPQNDMETAQIVTMLANDLSRETRLQMMPGVENVQDELKKLEEEKNKEQEEFGVYQSFAKAFQGAADETEAVTDEPEGT